MTVRDGILWCQLSGGKTCRLELVFPIANLTDYGKRLDELLLPDNAFGLVTAASLLTQVTRKLQDERHQGGLDDVPPNQSHLCFKALCLRI